MKLNEAGRVFLLLTIEIFGKDRGYCNNENCLVFTKYYTIYYNMTKNTDNDHYNLHILLLIMEWRKENGNKKRASKLLGIALHTAQDYYAHNVWGGKKRLYTFDYYKKYLKDKNKEERKKFHKTHFDATSKVYDGNHHWSYSLPAFNPRVKKAKAISRKIIKSYVKRVK